MLVFTFIVLTISIVAVTYVFLVMPRASDGADMDMQSTDYAHDGLFDACVPRASLDAFRRAKEQGYGIELRIILSRDGEVCVFLGSHLRPPLKLNELLSLIDGNVPLLIEITRDSSSFALCKKLCLIMDAYSGAFAIESPDPKILGFFKQFRPRYARGQIVLTKSQIAVKGKSRLTHFMRRHLFTNVISRPDFIVTHGNLLREPAFLLATRIFSKRGFIRYVKNGRQYSICRKNSLYAIFENIKPQ